MEILIIGGGVIGLSIARALHKKGFPQITILERAALGKESSYAAAGMLAPQAETDKTDEFFQFCSESNRLYPQFAAELFDETDVDIELDRSGTLYLAFTNEDVKEIRNRFEWQTSAGLQVEHLTARETRQAEPFVSPDVLESLFFPNDWQVENRKVLHALHKYCDLYGIEIRENTEVKNLLIENNRVAGAETEREKFRAETVVLATGAWTSLIKAGNFLLPRVLPVRGQMISFYTAKRIFSKVIYSPRGYLVPRADGRVLAGATVEDAGFDKTVNAEGIDFVREHALEIAPSLVNLEIQDTWAGLRPFAADGLPVVGECAEIENLLIATAHYRNGILLAPLTAQILADKIADGKDSDYFRFFSPKRFLAAGTI
jgi:glycine oxidase